MSTPAKEFYGFKFGNYSNDNLYWVSSSNSYDYQLMPTFKDVTAEVPGRDGQYYFGSTYQSWRLTINIAFENFSTTDLDTMFTNLHARNVRTLELEGLKTFNNAKLASAPKLKIYPRSGSLCGEGSLEFIVYDIGALIPQDDTTPIPPEE